MIGEKRQINGKRKKKFQTENRLENELRQLIASMKYEICLYKFINKE